LSGVTCTAAAAAAATSGLADRAATDRATSAATTSAAGYLHSAADFFLIEDIECGETDVGYFFLT
jgi:hypothetical protein